MYIFLDYTLKGQVEGLCGNFDDNTENDLVDMENGIVALTPEEFGPLWRVSGSCPDNYESEYNSALDTCEVRCKS